MRLKKKKKEKNKNVHNNIEIFSEKLSKRKFDQKLGDDVRNVTDSIKYSYKSFDCLKIP